MQLPYTTSEMESYIRQAAALRGIDPDVAVRVARSEGLQPGTWRAGYTRGRYREPSYGPFQLLLGGRGTGFPQGMGNDFQRETGLDPSDPENAFAAVDYALDRAATDGWGAWYGAPKVGVSRREGLENARPIGVRGTVVDPLSGELTQFAAATEAAGRVQPLPVDTELPGLFDTPALPGVDGGRPTQRQSIPVARRENPANPQFSDNAVGPLQSRDFGYAGMTPTVADLMGVLGGPRGTGPAAQATGSLAAQIATTPQDRSQVANARVANAFEDVRQPTTAQLAAQGLSLFGQQGPELASLSPSGPPRRLGPRRMQETPVAPRQIASVPARVEQTFSLFGPQEGIIAATTAQPAPQTTLTPQPRAQQSPLTPLEPARTVTQRRVAAPQGPRLDLVQGAAPSVAESVRSYGLFGDAGPGASYGYSPWGSGVARVYDNAPERVRIAATGPGLFGAFNDEFGTDIGIGPGRMMSPLTMALTAGLAAAGAGPLALAVPAASLLGAPQAAVNRMDVVPQSQRPQRQQPGLMQRLFSGNPLQGFAGGLFDARPTQQAEQQGGGQVTFEGPIGRNPSYVGEGDLSAAAQAAIDRATRGLY